MNSEPNADAPVRAPEDQPSVEAAVPGVVDAHAASAIAMNLRRAALAGIAVVALLALLASGLLWQKLSSMQEQLARQSADAGVQSIEARATARQAQELARDAAARVAVFEARLSEVALQRLSLIHISEPTRLGMTSYAV